jgi:hypothetical protein
LKTTRTWVLLACACAALAGAGVASAGIDVGVTEDAGKAGNGAAFFATLGDVGLKVNRISINWDPAAPTKIAGQAEIAKWLPQAQVSGTRIIFAVAPAQAKGLTATPEAKGQFIAFVQQLAATFPTVKDYVIGNEPNQPYFWVPQYSDAGKPLAAAQYLPVLAGSYDALKAKDPTINVIGVGLSPRGNDLAKGKNTRSRSPVRFLADLGRYYSSAAARRRSWTSSPSTRTRSRSRARLPSATPGRPRAWRTSTGSSRRSGTPSTAPRSQPSPRPARRSPGRCASISTRSAGRSRSRPRSRRCTTARRRPA